MRPASSTTSIATKFQRQRFPGPDQNHRSCLTLLHFKNVTNGLSVGKQEAFRRQRRRRRRSRRQRRRRVACRRPTKTFLLQPWLQPRLQEKVDQLRTIVPRAFQRFQEKIKTC